MKLKKMLYVVAFLFFMSLMFFMTGEVKAGELSSPMYFGIQEYRTDSDPQGMAYGINNPNKNGSTTDTITGAKIWDVVRYNSSSDSNYDNSIDYYCVRAGVGYRNTGDKATYDYTYDFKADRKSMLPPEEGSNVGSTNKYLNYIASDEVYYKILAMTDLMYIENVSTEQEKTELINAALTAAHIDVEEFPVGLTDSDIEAVQQAAIWYYTN